MPSSWTGSDGGIDWYLELERADLLPGRLVRGLLRLTAREDTTARGCIVTLRGEERWKYEVTTSNGKTTTTQVHTGREDLPPLPVRVSGPLSLVRGPGAGAPVRAPGPAARAADGRRRQGRRGVDRGGEARPRGRPRRLDRGPGPGAPADRAPARGRRPRRAVRAVRRGGRPGRRRPVGHHRARPGAARGGRAVHRPGRRPGARPRRRSGASGRSSRCTSRSRWVAVSRRRSRPGRDSLAAETTLHGERVFERGGRRRRGGAAHGRAPPLHRRGPLRADPRPSASRRIAACSGTSPSPRPPSSDGRSARAVCAVGISVV